MTTATLPAPRPRRSRSDLLDRILGADMGLLIALAAPCIFVIGLILLFGVEPAAWLVAIIMVVEVLTVAAVIWAFMRLMSDEPGDGASGG